MNQMLPQKLFVSGIGTEVGKTVVSAILVEAMKANYWKPVQAGDLDNTDTMKVRQWTSQGRVFYAEGYRLQSPMSPHAAAQAEGLHIDLECLSLPDHQGPLVVEGAGGLLVPLNDHDLMLDLITLLQIPVVLVSRHYLGSINHTLLSVFALQTRKIPIAGIIFNGETNEATESYILKYTQVPCLAKLGEEPEITPLLITKYAQQWQSEWKR
jgi:dethiobiotin synthetase